ncbi:Acetyl esterase/lipase [Quadrisphaera granulorum]|uniref:Acetyl esterase/lipase n=1 Tax=Quadrisphaera granulorum TaxID=317664 RepID=A0A315ZRX2_9ACTN|nr:alpha/beta hydrolase [Quadrisphaera granulorum]PWJ48296.1 acetyl esterase/lipase [Quadrisphaera granulorum]SZE98457.1 Acetyl esterase/lipase [Quadrisphaera granulorum]
MERPRFDPELRAGLALVGGVFPPTVTPDLIDFMRRSYASRPLVESLAGRSVTCEDVVVEGFAGAPVTVSVLRNPRITGPRPGMLYAHSGGMIFGDRFSGLDQVFDWVEHLGLVVVTPEYRRAPEYPDPVPREDCYAALEWTAAHAADLGIRLDRLLVGGASAGGGLAAGLALAARDRGGPALCGQLLDFPMLDDRGVTDSTRAFDGVGVWDRVSNETGWTALLGAAVGGPDVSPYAAPARATDLRHLPQAFVSVGEAEIFRDEAVAYASALWGAGVDAELHVWPGGFHAFDIFAPHTALARSLASVRNAWLERVVGD